MYKTEVKHRAPLDSYLATRELALDNVLEFSRHLSFNVLLKPPQYKWADNSMETGDDIIILSRAALHHTGHRVGEPVRELFP